ncbi:MULTISPECIES: dihydrolipoamide acetyltransferase family protein [Pseudomonas]|mgnify:CR=1 FL=1|jgi:2-oxoisovalerate dehydrogenase E2 component (dihydrolipoyl transacylase)|uniref:dihydrolipoamide acetyltransferase family protein n=1 Tax=Pseudomonas TaxID=286 RepID=UPI000716EA34|nr:MULTISPECIES: dihydrolipoamide acetyltransferase family protein [Pseudomonas]MDZ4302039.1 dihydrolipoamide acetyltransferase family protein [Pseudomonas sp.]OAE15180.1 branched-chain alpha-keto acid dehydrogenase subunit E2 [Pseudomonas brenneri]MBJ2242486.1 2-oxo acid dehydrogenase subunit E2 [Pseudomonas sp. MF6768]MBJ2254257.1 2-oxo acid dehydrogenase subunit E2 [Pseudomonas sp. MF6784]MBK3454607.1 2-oxo acid dehydrogenase subunit E2 [Pseudomonas sp. MF6754]
MGTHVIKMPDIGEGIAEVELSVWHVKVGDMVVEDQVLADVMTDKAMVDIPSPVHGKVISLGGEPGEVMAVGSILISIEVEGAGNTRESALSAVVEEAAPAPKAEIKAPAVESKPAAKPVVAAQAPVARDANERPLASPAVRKHALDAGIQLRLVQGSGPAGRILHEDLDAYLQQGSTRASAGANPYAERNDEEQIPVIGMRRKIAQRMQDATRRAAHFSYVEEIDVTALDDLRVHLNEKHGASRGKLTLLPFLVRAMVVALRDFPQINARYDDEAQVITRLGAVHVGVATQSDVGLMVPVVRHAEARSLWGTAEEITRLANAARNGKASRDELSGSTITLTSLGALGGIVSTPVLNLPEVAIVGVNRIVERPMVIKGQIVIRKMMNLSSSFDHRVVDGMDAAQFIQAIRGLLEQPASLFLE